MNLKNKCLYALGRFTLLVIPFGQHCNGLS